MLKTFSPRNGRPYLMGFMLAFSLFALSADGVKAQSVAIAGSNSAEGHSLPLEASETAKKAPKTVPNVKKPLTTEEKLDALAQMVEQQNERLNQLQQTISEQQETIRLLVGKANVQPASTVTSTALWNEVAAVRIETLSHTASLQLQWWQS